jgi:iron complex outermembrane receptor protein
MRARYLAALLGSVSLLTLSINGSAKAQAQPSPSGQAQGLEEIVVTARRVQEKLQNVPVMDTAFTPKDLEEKQIRGVADIGMGVPNMQIKYAQFSTPNSPEFVIRGISAVSNQIAIDSPIGIYIDGVYVYGELGQSFQMGDIEQIEVLEGPQGTLFGRNTTGGAISVTTKNPTGEFGGHLETSFGNFGSHRVQASVDLPEFDGFSVRLNVFHDDRGFMRTNPLGGTQFTLPPPFGQVTVAGGYSNLDENGGRIAIRYTGIDDLLVDFKADYSENFNGTHATQNIGFSPSDQAFSIAYLIATGQFQKLTPAFASLPASLFSSGPYALPTNVVSKAQKVIPSWFDYDNGSEKVFSFNLTAQYDFNDNLSIKNIAAYRSQRLLEPGTDLGGTALYTPPLSTVLNGLIPNTTFTAGLPFCYSICTAGEVVTVHTTSEELQAIGHYDRFDFIGGFFWIEQTGFIFDPAPLFAGSQPFVQTTYARGLLGNPFLLGDGVSGADNDSWAVYAHATAHLTDSIDLSAGVRYSYDDRNSTKFDQVSPAAFAGLAYSIASQQSISYDNVDWEMSLLWKATDNINTYAKVSTGYLSGGIINTGAFNPVTITSYEAGVKTEWFDHRLRFNVTGWHTKQVGEQANVLNTSAADLAANGFPPNTPLGSAILSNPIHIHRTGMEIQTAVRPIEGLTLGVNVGIQSEPPIDGVFQDQPEHNMGINAEYDLPKFDNGMFFAIRADATWEDTYLTGGFTVKKIATIGAANPALLAAMTREATWVLDMRATLADIPIWGDTKGKIAVWAKNLTNEQNINFAYDLGFNTSGTYDLPRTYGVDLAVDF